MTVRRQAPCQRRESGPARHQGLESAAEPFGGAGNASARNSPAIRDAGHGPGLFPPISIKIIENSLGSPYTYLLVPVAG